MSDDMKSDDLKSMALHYHRTPVPGKIEVAPTKPLATQRDLALAYSPGVAYACEAIVEDPNEAATVTARGNLVAVITNGTAVLGLGAIGPLAGKPVMEGKGVLFKKFAGINVFDIEIDERDPEKLVEIIASLEPTFGGINLEDIKAPECFYVEQQLRSRMKIPVFHDDQHGTAIITAAAVLNGLRLVGKRIGEVQLVCSGAGAAAIACLDLLVALGLDRANTLVCDSKGVIFAGRDEKMDASKARYARSTDARTLADAIVGADIFLGVSGPGVLTQDMVKTMGPQPLILALANPTPEILPELAKAVRPDAIIATGRSDYPNQVNNVLCFPYIFRGALDVGATVINEEMKLACVRALADLTMQEPTEEVMAAYSDQTLSFGPEYLIPKPFDPRLILEMPIAVARAAMASGVATRPIEDFTAYREELSRFVIRSGMVMKPVFERAKADPKRVVYAEGEDDRVLRAVQVVVDDGLARPLLIGRPERIAERIKALGLHVRPGEDVEVVDMRDHPYYEACWKEYHRLRERRGMTMENARIRVRTRGTVLGALMVRLGLADTMICGTVGRFRRHYEHIVDVIGQRNSVQQPAAMSLLLTPKGPLFLADTHINIEPSAEEIAQITALAAEEVRRFGITPKVALLSHSNFGSDETASSRKMARAFELLKDMAPELEVEGEMQGDTALSEPLRNRLFPNSTLSGSANLLILPTLDAANIAYNLVKMVTDAVAIGPMLMGVAKPVHVLTTAATVRRIVNMSALAAVDAQVFAAQEPDPSI
ncbi:allosteric NADP-dependent malic enzyme [Plasticicumulans lactativorans]|uniref:NADP-dependent malic enzyme n=1 Tax=Plasticicumulans lactativorans TaxID=1133106 RepID=A0A4R2LNT9_9GAMM|nr:NADP-dependent malic enzyme [Plasticicumulans lactativorans]TCO81125.1 allosteric NADP-dependent malic enzyme [Plasticicumulans lactativorans]